MAANTGIQQKALNIREPGAIEMVRDLLALGLKVRIQVSGASMQPFLEGGEHITLQGLDEQSLILGDLLLLADDKGLVLVHRLVRKWKQDGKIMVQTQGDALVGLDAAMPFAKVICRVVCIEKAGQGRAHNLDKPAARFAAWLRARAGLLRYYIYRFLHLLG